MSADHEVPLPSRLPQPFVVGSRVMVRLRYPYDGVFLGTVDAVMDGRYRVFFDKDIVSPMTIQDMDMCYAEPTPHDSAPISFFFEKNKAAQPFGVRYVQMYKLISLTKNYCAYCTGNTQCQIYYLC